MKKGDKKSVNNGAAQSVVSGGQAVGADVREDRRETVLGDAKRAKTAAELYDVMCRAVLVAPACGDAESSAARDAMFEALAAELFRLVARGGVSCITGAINALAGEKRKDFRPGRWDNAVKQADVIARKTCEYLKRGGFYIGRKLLFFREYVMPGYAGFHDEYCELLRAFSCFEGLAGRGFDCLKKGEHY